MPGLQSESKERGSCALLTLSVTLYSVWAWGMMSLTLMVGHPCSAKPHTCTQGCISWVVLVKLAVETNHPRYKHSDPSKLSPTDLLNRSPQNEHPHWSRCRLVLLCLFIFLTLLILELPISILYLRHLLLLCLPPTPAYVQADRL